ncbi:MAG: VOC family protein [Thermomicrobium sp.]|nr:VOC family protein [Thermomicrobium sp.]MDW8060120.1 VOC family protein [Thermomicrobium sp.]
MSEPLTPIQPEIVPAPTGSGTLPYGLPDPSDRPLLPAPRAVRIEAIQHIAIRVADLRTAESFYRELFGMEVVWRVRRSAERWEYLPADFDWDAGLRTGIYPQYVLLRNGPLALLLQFAGRGTVFVEPRLVHLSVRVAPETLAEIRAEVLVREYPIAQSDEHAFVFRDPFGITWHVTDLAVTAPPDR